MIGAGNDIDGTHQTLNSSSFYMIRTMQMISSSLVPIVPSATPTATITTTTAPTSILDTSAPVGVSGLPTNLPASDGKTSALSPLVIGLISAGIVTLLIAIVALTLLLRSQKRSKDFKSLHDPPSSPTDDASKRSILKAEEGYELTGDGSGFGPTTTGPATGRSSSTTARSADPMIKNAPTILGYHASSPSPSSPVSPMPLLERKPSLTQRALLEPKPAEGSRTSGEVEAGATGAAVGSQQASALTAGDAQLIADTFRKSMRTPRWEDDVEEEEPEDEARRAANQLLRQELSQQGLDVRRGVQRRVTIQDRINRQSVPTPISETVSIPVPVPLPDP
ncbi:hypothetical protein BGX34_008949 [Mortierella sp. NVP85]|nr:hypothetical protein BGX34_008949 [Mortierella sp. NVP85]